MEERPTHEDRAISTNSARRSLVISPPMFSEDAVEHGVRASDRGLCFPIGLLFALVVFVEPALDSVECALVAGGLDAHARLPAALLEKRPCSIKRIATLSAPASRAILARSNSG